MQPAELRRLETGQLIPYHPCMEKRDYQPLIELALKEDLGELGDITTQAIAAAPCRALLLSKDEGILAGEEVFTAVFQRLDPQVRVDFLFHDGDSLKPGDEVAAVEGMSGTILSAERTALNFLSFLSGVATQTHLFVQEAARHGKAQILDTRKTPPGYRALCKYAVRAGGGVNHRQGLFDMILIKDNHIERAGSVGRAIESVREKWGDRFTVEVECRDLEEVAAALAGGADILMLDNMSLELIRQAVSMTRGRARLEVSGRMDLEGVRRVSSEGVDRISVGRITHSVSSFDFSLQVVRAG